MQWVWQLPDWPKFTLASLDNTELLLSYNQNIGYVLGSFSCIDEQEQASVKVELYVDETMQTSAIEGEILERASVQSSLQKQLGLKPATAVKHDKNYAITQMLVKMYDSYAEELTHDMLCEWNLDLTSHRFELTNVGRYRHAAVPMQIVSYKNNTEKIHYEAPPGQNIEAEMDKYIHWFNNDSKELDPLTRASVAHLYFECIHPFEDGNGRIGRALVLKSLSQSANKPVLSNFSNIINKDKKKYYDMLSGNNRSLEASAWVNYFNNIIVAGQEYTQQYLEFILKKTKIFNMHGSAINARQTKVIKKMFSCGLEGFEGGLSTENYMAITQTSRATAVRDLNHLLAINILYKTGKLKATRYYLQLDH